ncbi:MAG: peptidylprolyl isomerase [Anaerolineaceae bacterium]|nr:peptidylprolyl isomerase [Anaerolineaceae bacterium]
MTDTQVNIVQNDMIVLLEYTLTVDGQEVDSGPIEYLQGHKNIIPGLESAVAGMKVGESKDVTVKAIDAYGEYDEEAVVNVARTSFPKDFEIKLGHPMRIRDESGNIFSGTVTALGDENVELDLNHPLAGKDLLFKATVSDLRAATDEELAHGHVQSSCGGCGSQSSGCSSDGCGSSCC